MGSDFELALYLELELLHRFRIRIISLVCLELYLELALEIALEIELYLEELELVIDCDQVELMANSLTVQRIKKSLLLYQVGCN